jgi:hypothetical protein
MLIIEILNTALKAYSTYQEYERNSTLEQLRETVADLRMQIATVAQKSKDFTIQQIILHEFDDVAAQIRALMEVLDLMVKNPQQSFLSTVAVDTFEGLERVAIVIDKIIKIISRNTSQGQLETPEILLTTAVAYAHDLYSICCTATKREEALTPPQDLSSVRDKSKQRTRGVVDMAKLGLRLRSDARFHSRSRRGEPMPGGKWMYIYYYTFDEALIGNKWVDQDKRCYEENEANPAHNKSAIAQVQAAMRKHQDIVFPDFPGIADVLKILWVIA